MKASDEVIHTGRWSRRDTLKLALAAGVGSSLRWVPASADATKPLRTREIPASGEQLPIVGMGSSGSYETASGADLEDQRKVLQLFVEQGGTLVDTSPTYGNAEANIGKLAADLELRDRLFMATKVHERGRDAGIRQMEGSEKRLDKPLDLMQVHNLIDVKTQLKTLREWKQAGRIRYLGITHYLTSAFEELETLMRNEPMDFVQFNYSIVTPEAEKRLLPLAADKGIAVLINRAYEDGRLFGRVKGKKLPTWAAEFDAESWGQFFLKYVLGHPAVTCVIPATSDPEHLVDNMGAGRGALPTDPATRKRIREFMADL